LKTAALCFKLFVCVCHTVWCSDGWGPDGVGMISLQPRVPPASIYCSTAWRENNDHDRVRLAGIVQPGRHGDREGLVHACRCAQLPRATLACVSCLAAGVSSAVTTLMSVVFGGIAVAVSLRHREGRTLAFCGHDARRAAARGAGGKHHAAGDSCRPSRLLSRAQVRRRVRVKMPPRRHIARGAEEADLICLRASRS
jgi:hypothetical protein